MTAYDDDGPTLLPATARAGRDDPVDRILDNSYVLFSRRGIRGVGVNDQAPIFNAAARGLTRAGLDAPGGKHPVDLCQ